MALVFNSVAAAVALLVILQTTFQVNAVPLDKSKGGKDKGKDGLEEDGVSDLESAYDSLAEDMQAQLLFEDEGRAKRSAETSALAEDSPLSSADAFVDDVQGEEQAQLGGKKPCRGNRGGSNGTATDSDAETMQQRQGRKGGKKRGGNAPTTEEPAKLAASWLIGDAPEALW